MTEKQVVIFAPTPAPYRAYEYDLVSRGLAGRYRFHALFMERTWAYVPWHDDLPLIMPWEVLPQSPFARLLRRLPGFRRVNRGVWRRLERLNPDAVIVQGYDATAVWCAWLWATLRRRALLFRSDANVAKDLYGRRRRLKFVAKHAYVRSFLSQVGAFISIGSANEAYYRRYGARQETFFRASYMVNAAQFGQIAAAERQAGKPLKEQLGIRQGRVLLFVGRLVWEKDLSNVLKAFARARADLPDTALLIVGEGPEKEGLQRMAGEIGDSIYFAGFRQPDELARFYALADALVLASIQEAWGLVINEAMAAGVAVIASDRVGATVDLVLPGITGATFPAANVEAMAQAFVSVLTDVQVARRLGEAGRRHLEDWNCRHEVVEGYRRALDFALWSRNRATRPG